MASHKTDPINPKKTLFLSNIDPSITAEELKKYFSSFGSISSVKLIQSIHNATDPVNSAYINFLNPQYAALAKEKSQYLLLGQKNIRIYFQKDEKDFLLETVLFIENLPPSCTPEVLKRHFIDCGAPVSDVRVDNSREGQILGRGYALFKTITLAKNALKMLEGKNLEGRELEVTCLGPSSVDEHFEGNTSIYIKIVHQHKKLGEVKDFLKKAMRKYGALKKKLRIYTRSEQICQVIVVFNERDDGEAAISDLKRNPKKYLNSRYEISVKDAGWYSEKSMTLNEALPKVQDLGNEQIPWRPKAAGSGEAIPARVNKTEKVDSLDHPASQNLHKIGSKKFLQKEAVRISPDRKEPQKGNDIILELRTEEEVKDKDAVKKQKDFSNSIYTTTKPADTDQNSSKESQSVSSLTITSEASNSIYKFHKTPNLWSISALTGPSNTGEENDYLRLDSSKLNRLEIKNRNKHSVDLIAKETDEKENNEKIVIKESKQYNKKVFDKTTAGKINQKNNISISQFYKKHGTRKKRRRSSKAETQLIYHLKGENKHMALDRSMQELEWFNRKKQKIIWKESLFEVARKYVRSKLTSKVAEMLADSIKYKPRELEKLINNKKYARDKCREMINIIKRETISLKKKTQEWDYNRQRQQKVAWVVKQNFGRIMGIKLTEFLRFDVLVRSQRLENFLLPIVSRLTNNTVAPRIVRMLIHISEKAQRELINIVEDNNYLQKKVQRLYKFLKSSQNKESRSLYFQIESCQQETKQKKPKNRTRNAMNKQYNNMDNYLAYIVNCNMAYFMYNQMVMQSMRMRHPFGYQIGYQNIAGYQHINKEIVESKPMVIEHQLTEEKAENVQKVEKIPKVEKELNKLKEEDRKEDQVNLNLSILKESLEDRVIRHFKRKLSTLNGYKPDKKESVLAEPLLPCIISLTDKKLGLEVFKKFKEKHVLKSVEGVMDLLDDPCLLKDQIEAIKKEFKG